MRNEWPGRLWPWGWLWGRGWHQAQRGWQADRTWAHAEMCPGGWWIITQRWHREPKPGEEPRQQITSAVCPAFLESRSSEILSPESLCCSEVIPSCQVGLKTAEKKQTRMQRLQCFLYSISEYLFSFLLGHTTSSRKNFHWHSSFYVKQ